MVCLKLVLSAAFLVLLVLAGEGFVVYHKDPLGVLACETLLTKSALLFKATDKAGYCNVDNQPALGSMAICLKQLPHKKSINTFIKSCSSYGLTKAEFEAAYENATEYLFDPTEDSSFLKTKLCYKPIKLSNKVVNGAWHSVVGRYINYNWAYWFGTALLAYWFFVMFVAGICNYTYFLFPGFVKSLKGGFVNTFRKYISLPATGRKAHAENKTFLWIFQCLVPTRLETILIAGWFVLALAFNVCNYNHDYPNLFWSVSESTEIGRKIADRTGVMVLFLIPAMVLFAGRNNFMQWVSGWPQSRFIMIHKWISRAGFLLIMTHAVGMTYNGKGLGKYEIRNSEEYVRWGYVALVAASIMCFHSLLVFRKQNYELFVLTHIILACIFIIGGWRHCEEVLFDQFFKASVAVWVFDRGIRICRLAAFGVQTAHVELKANETLKVVVKRPAYWKPFPGCHAFIHFLRPTCFWQSHPFTIVDSAVEEGTITFYLKVKGGMTHGLYQFLAKQPGHSSEIKVMVEGPYGQRIPVNRNETAVFFAGGNGVPGLYYEARELSRRNVDNQRVRFYWIIRHYKSIDWFHAELLKFKDTIVEPIIYVTQPDAGLSIPIAQSDDLSKSEAEEAKKDDEYDDQDHPDEEKSHDYIQALKNSLSFVEFREGRPPIASLVQEEMTTTNGSIAFVACAHPSMVDDARKAVVDNISSCPHRVELFEQMQIW